MKRIGLIGGMGRKSTAVYCRRLNEQVRDTLGGRGVVEAASKQRYLDIVAKGKAAGADSVTLGCTEIGLLVDDDDVDLPTFDSTLLHADAAIELSLASEPDYRSHSGRVDRAQGDGSAPPMY
jgi:aspartate/glutamate racemase